MMDSITKYARLWLTIVFVMGIMAYCIPWLTNAGAGLTFGAYDLAEWASLHPAVRSSTPPLITSLFLRLPLACFGVIIATMLWERSPGKRVAFLLLIGITLLPPLEFFTQYRDDPNYQQQFALALATILVGAAMLMLHSAKWTKAILVGCALIGGVSGLLGLTQSFQLMRGVGLNTEMGSGGLLFIVLNAILAALLVMSAPTNPLKQTR